MCDVAVTKTEAPSWQNSTGAVNDSASEQAVTWEYAKQRQLLATHRFKPIATDSMNCAVGLDFIKELRHRMNLTTGNLRDTSYPLTVCLYLFSALTLKAIL